jgi:hypothetical protein
MIEGSKIVRIRAMTDAEYKREYWDNCPNHPVYVLELDNGMTIYPSCDYEGNGGGALFGHDSKTNTDFTVAIDRKKPVDTTKMDNDEFGKYIREDK